MTRHAIALRSFCCAAVLAVMGWTSSAAGPRQVVVFAAASLKTALDEVAMQWEASTGGDMAISYAGSSELARQVGQGAPADIFISANVDWMDVLETDGLIDAASRRNLLGNSLVLIAHGKDAAPVAIGPDFDLGGMLGEGLLAMALVDAVPAGIYGKAALTSLGLWEDIGPRVAQTDNVRTALALVARGEAPLGIVYATDAVAEDNVTVVATFPADTHAPIIYPAALIAGSGNADAAAFLDYLTTETARPIFERQGFTVID